MKSSKKSSTLRLFGKDKIAAPQTPTAKRFNELAEFDLTINVQSDHPALVVDQEPPAQSPNPPAIREESFLPVSHPSSTIVSAVAPSLTTSLGASDEDQPQQSIVHYARSQNPKDRPATHLAYSDVATEDPGGNYTLAGEGATAIVTTSAKMPQVAKDALSDGTDTLGPRIQASHDDPNASLQSHGNEIVAGPPTESSIPHALPNPCVPDSAARLSLLSNHVVAPNGTSSSAPTLDLTEDDFNVLRGVFSPLVEASIKRRQGSEVSTETTVKLTNADVLELFKSTSSIRRAALKAQLRDQAEHGASRVAIAGVAVAAAASAGAAAGAAPPSQGDGVVEGPASCAKAAQVAGEGGSGAAALGTNGATVVGHDTIISEEPLQASSIAVTTSREPPELSDDHASPTVDTLKTGDAQEIPSRKAMSSTLRVQAIVETALPPNGIAGPPSQGVQEAHAEGSRLGEPVRQSLSNDRDGGLMATTSFSNDSGREVLNCVGAERKVMCLSRVRGRFGSTSLPLDTDPGDWVSSQSSSGDYGISTFLPPHIHFVLNCSKETPGGSERVETEWPSRQLALLLQVNGTAIDAHRTLARETTSNQPLFITALVKPGTNRVEIISVDDLSDRCFYVERIDTTKVETASTQAKTHDEWNHLADTLWADTHMRALSI